MGAYVKQLDIKSDQIHVSLYYITWLLYILHSGTQILPVLLTIFQRNFTILKFINRFFSSENKH